MKLYYYKDPNGLRNFGDDLNAWLWPKIAPDLLDEDETEILVGLGTLLNDGLHKKLPATCRQIAVFSSGVGYGTAPPHLDERWKIHCVRGPLSARALGIPDNLAITDGAVLLRRLYTTPTQKIHRFSYMPHAAHSRAAGGAWEELCRSIDFGYIDARWPIEHVLGALASTDVLLTEAMHGAIVADALRIPWIPVHSTGSILAFKWRDWCASVDLEYRPNRILPLWERHGRREITKSVKHVVKRQFVAWQLLKIAKTTRPILSRTSHIENLTQRMEDKLLQLKNDAENSRLRDARCESGGDSVSL